MPNRGSGPANPPGAEAVAIKDVIAIVPENGFVTWNRLTGFLIFTVAVFPGDGRSGPICATCHAKETARFLQTGMGNSL